MNKNPVNIYTLTPLRGIAAILVAVYHFNYSFIIDPPHSYIFLNKCYLFVDLFFIMSGFIMMHVYHNKFSLQVNFESYKKFLLARFARIYPLHLFMLLLFVLLIYLGGHGGRTNPIYSPYAIFTNIFLLQSCGIHDTGTWNVPSWSISAEWWAYVIFPFVCFCIFRKKYLTITVMLISILFIYLLILFYLPRSDKPAYDPDLDVSFDYGYLRGIAGFCSGMLVYLLFRLERIKYFFRKDWVGLFIFTLVIIGMEANVNDMIFIPVFVLLILAFACNDGIICKVSQIKFLQFIGDISYSFYLIHALIILLGIQGLIHTHYGYDGPFIKGIFKSSPLLLVFLFVVGIFSTITYNYIEKPSRDWINKKFHHNKIAGTP